MLAILQLQVSVFNTSVSISCLHFISCKFLFSIQGFKISAKFTSLAYGKSHLRKASPLGPLQPPTATMLRAGKEVRIPVSTVCASSVRAHSVRMPSLCEAHDCGVKAVQPLHDVRVEGMISWLVLSLCDENMVLSFVCQKAIPQYECVPQEY